MSETHSTPPDAPGKATKPAKPPPDFPLFPYAAGVWANDLGAPSGCRQTPPVSYPARRAPRRLAWPRPARRPG
jgi:hypothetical protein